MPFEVPESWEWIRLEEFVLAVTDGDHLPPPQVLKGIPFLVISDVNTGVISFDKARFVSESYYHSLPDIRKATKGDLLFTVTGSYGIVVPVETEREFCFQRHIGLIKIIECSSWILYVLQSNYVQTYCDKVATGTAQKTVSLGHLRDLLIPIPPLDEQERIVSQLDVWLDAVGKLQNSEKELRQAIGKTKSKVLELAISGRLVTQELNDESALELLKRINPDIKIPCDNPHYQNIPKSWCICTIADIAVSELGKTLDKEKNKGEYKPYLCSANVLWNRFDLSGLKQMRFEDDETDRYSIKKNDLIICEGGDAGRCAVWTSDDSIMFQNALHRVRFYYGISPYFIMYVLMFLKQNGLLEEYCKGVTIKHFTKTALSGLQIPLPPIGEQYRIVSKIEEYFGVLFNIEATI